MMGPAADVDTSSRLATDQDSDQARVAQIPSTQKQAAYEAASQRVPMAPKPSRDHVVPVNDMANGQSQVNGHSHPADTDALNRDALSRIQTQVSYNTAGLQAQKRDIEALGFQDRDQIREIQKINGALSQLQSEMAYVLDMVRQFQERPNMHNRSPAQPGRTDDTALEVMAAQMATMSVKVHEVDSLKLEVELLKRRLKKAEEPGQPPSQPGYNYQRIPPINQTPESQNRTPPAPAPAPVPPAQFVSRAPAEARPTSSYRHSSASELAQTVEPEVRAGGWATVNASVKRPPPPLEETNDGAGTALGSPKRPKLAPLEPRLSYNTAPDAVYERMETDTADPRHRPNSNESYASNHTPSNFITYSNSQEGNAESWHAMNQDPNAAKHGGRSSSGRSARPRKHPNDSDGTPEWERPEWVGSQVNDGNWYTHTTPGKPARGAPIRRGTSSGAPPVSRNPSDPYAHTKKTRTKPVRNAEGILIRKDGQPDMRSQSSAANLRKVHARKEQEKNGEGPRTPTSGLATAPVIGTSQSPENYPESGGEQDVQRHQDIMRQIFPRGVDEQRDRDQYAERYFPSEKSPTEPKSESTRHSAAAEPMSETGSKEPEGDRDVTMGENDTPQGSEPPAEKERSAPSSRSADSPARTASEGVNKSPEVEA